MSSPTLLVSKSARKQRRHSLGITPTTEEDECDEVALEQGPLRGILKRSKSDAGQSGAQLVEDEAVSMPSPTSSTKKKLKKRQCVTFRSLNRATDVYYFTDDEDSRECRRGYDALNYFGGSFALAYDDDDDDDYNIEDDYGIDMNDAYNRGLELQEALSLSENDASKPFRRRLRRDSFDMNAGEFLLEERQKQTHSKPLLSFLLRDSSSQDDEGQSFDNLEDLYIDSDDSDYIFGGSSIESLDSSPIGHDGYKKEKEKEEEKESKKEKKKKTKKDTVAKADKGSHHHRHHDAHSENSSQHQQGETRKKKEREREKDKRKSKTKDKEKEKENTREKDQG